MDLYAENILDHYKHPHNKGALEQSTVHFADTNPLCGDKIEMFVLIDNKGMISDIRFEGIGCAISQASASMLTDEVKGKNIQDVSSLCNEQIYDMLGVPLTTNRVKCALLSLVTLKKALALFHYESSKENL